jgi:hypothetical protein
MWVTAVNIATLVLGVLRYVAFAARKLDASLTALLDDQSERLHRIERDLDRVRQAIAITTSPGCSLPATYGWARRNGSLPAGYCGP